MGKIAIVTDSTADMPLSYYAENDITMVPLTVRIGNEEYKDWVEMAPNKFFKMLLNSQGQLPKTSQPSVQEFIEAYEKHKDCDHIISVHISSKLSGTYQSALVASKSVSIPVTVIDTKLASIGIAAVLRKLVEARNEGKSVDEMICLAEAVIRKIRIAFYVDTLKYLELGGRIGKASALIGSILNIKPILTLENGIVAPLKKVKGRKRVNKEIISYIKETSGRKELEIGMAHANAPEALEKLESALKEAGIKFNTFLKSEFGSVIGTYVGPGAFAIMFYPSDLKLNESRLHKACNEDKVIDVEEDEDEEYPRVVLDESG